MSVILRGPRNVSCANDPMGKVACPVFYVRYSGLVNTDKSVGQFGCVANESTCYQA
jgi:hypothetical protein